MWEIKTANEQNLSSRMWTISKKDKPENLGMYCSSELFLWL